MRVFINSKSLEILRFFCVGISVTLVHISIVFCLFYFFNKMSVYIANSVGFAISFVISYLGHRYITFNNKGSLGKFFIISAFGFIVNNLLLTIGMMFYLPKTFAIFVAIILVPAITYLLSLSWAFKKIEEC